MGWNPELHQQKEWEVTWEYLDISSIEFVLEPRTTQVHNDFRATLFYVRNRFYSYVISLNTNIFSGLMLYKCRRKSIVDVRLEYRVQVQALIEFAGNLIIGLDKY